LRAAVPNGAAALALGRRRGAGLLREAMPKDKSITITKFNAGAWAKQTLDLTGATTARSNGEVRVTAKTAVDKGVDIDIVLVLEQQGGDWSVIDVGGPFRDVLIAAYTHVDAERANPIAAAMVEKSIKVARHALKKKQQSAAKPVTATPTQPSVASKGITRPSPKPAAARTAAAKASPVATRATAPAKTRNQVGRGSGKSTKP